MNYISEYPISTVKVYHRHTIRSTFMISKVKHCFEATYSSGCQGFEVGFASHGTQRSFVAYCGTSKFWDIDSTVFNQYPHQLSINTGDTVMVCLDSENSIITAKTKNKEESTKYSIVNLKTWYAYVDAESSCPSSSSAVLKVNLGKTKFNNTMPKGYAPFIYSLGSIFAKKRTKVAYNKQHINIKYIILIQISK